MKRKVKKIIRFITNPRLILCIAIGWVLTNGWSYVLFAVGTYFEINWMVALSGAYLAFLWLPISPEKLITFTIAILLLNKFFPDDQKTLAVLRELKIRVEESFRKKDDDEENPPDV